MRLIDYIKDIDIWDQCLKRKRYFYIPISLFNEQRQIDSKTPFFYCENKAVEHALEYIGEYRGTNTDKSNYRKGIEFICKAYYEQYKEPLFIAEVKRVVRPTRKHRKDDHDKISKSGYIKVPYKLIKILSCITEHIDTPSDAPTIEKCKKCRNQFCIEKNVGKLYCYHYLVFNLYLQLLSVQVKWNNKAKMAKVCGELINNKKACN